MDAFQSKQKASSESEIEKPSKVVQNTNLYTTYFRSYSDIPFAAKFSSLVRAKEAYEHDKEKIGPVDTKIPYFEARYKAIDALIKASGINQVVEFAAGRSLRGINNPQWKFVHTDQDPVALEQMWSFGKKVLSEQGRMPAFVGFDAITGEGLSNITLRLNNQPVVVIHEGLYTYYPHATKEKMAENAKKLLEIYGGLYITPDVHIKSNMAEWNTLEVRSEKQRESISDHFKRDIESFYFEDRADVKRFFSNIGFDSKVHTLGEFVPSLSSTKKLFSDPSKIEIVDKVTKSLEIWQMSLRR